MSEIILTAKEANLLRDIVMHNEYGETWITRPGVGPCVVRRPRVPSWGA